MGESAEEMAVRNEIPGTRRDELAVRSHHRAAAAIASGRLASEVIPVETEGKTVHTDTIVRADTSVEKLAKLKPAFAKQGTLTAGNSTPLTDGGAAVLLMTRRRPRRWA
jgi:acetyl-CoA acyltransferase